MKKDITQKGTPARSYKVGQLLELSPTMSIHKVFMPVLNQEQQAAVVAFPFAIDVMILSS